MRTVTMVESDHGAGGTAPWHRVEEVAMIPEPKVWVLSWHLHTGTEAEQKALKLSHNHPPPHVPYPESQGT